MTTTKQMIEVMQAYEDGKAIEFKNKNGHDWHLVRGPIWDWSTNEYRIRSTIFIDSYLPGPTPYRMFKDLAGETGIVQESGDKNSLFFGKCSHCVCLTKNGTQEVVDLLLLWLKEGRLE